MIQILCVALVIMLTTDLVVYILTTKERIKLQELREELIEYEKSKINK